MVKMNDEKKAGIAVLIGFIIAVLLGVFSSQIDNIPLNIFITYNLLIKNIVLALLVVTGIVLGFYNLYNKEDSKILLASLTVLVVSYVGANVLSSYGKTILIGPVVFGVLESILIMFIPFALMIALKIILTNWKR